MKTIKRVTIKEFFGDDVHTHVLKIKTTYLPTNENYLRGLQIGRAMEHVSIALNHTWGGQAKDGASVCAYEKIGYHAGSEAFLLGVLDSQCKVFGYRVTKDSIEKVILLEK